MTTKPSTEPTVRPRRSPARPLVALLLTLLALALGITQLLRTEGGTRWLLGHVPGLQASGVRGALWSERLEIDTLRWQGSPQQPTLEVQALRLAQPHWRWLPHAGAWLMLHAPSLQAARVQWRAPSEPAPGGAPPTQWQLPFALQIDALQVAQLHVDDQPPWLDLRAAVRFGADGGREHRIDALTLRNDRVQIRADVRVGSLAPLPLHLTIQAEPINGTPWRVQAQADGPLADFAASATLRSDARNANAPRLDATARITPFAPWPLAALELSTRALDLAAFSSAAPHTQIDAKAQVQTAGLDRPAQAKVELRNHRPGRIDAQRLPLRELRLQLAGTPAQLDRIDITQLQAQLADDQAPAGTVRGRGQWSGSKLAIDVQIAQVEPARLHGAAAALRTDGTLALQLSGVPLPRMGDKALPASAPQAGSKDPNAVVSAPTVPWSLDIKGTLDGTPLRRAGPRVRAELQLALSADAVKLTRLSATAGEATAQAVLTAQRVRQGTQPTWQIASQGELSRFDPLAWWPGAAGSAWARGPHRWSGRWHLDAQADDTLAASWRRDPAAALAAARGQARLEWSDSLLAGVPINGRIEAHGDGRALAVDARANAAGNDVALNGTWSSEPSRDRWKIDAAWPALAALQPIAALAPALSPQVWPSAGAAHLHAQLEGRWLTLGNAGTAGKGGATAFGGSGTLQVSGLSRGDSALQEGRAQWRLTPGHDPSIELTVALNGASHGPQRLDTLQAQVNGSLRDHRISLQASSPLRPPAWSETLLGSAEGGTQLTFASRGAWSGAPGGNASWLSRDASLRVGARSGRPNASNSAAGRTTASAISPSASNGASSSTAKSPLDNGTWIAASNLEIGVQLDAARAITRVELAPGRLALPGGAALRWTQAAWQPQANRFDLASQLEPLALAPLLARLQPELGWGGDLRLAGRIDVHAAERFDADIELARSGGDLRIADETGAAQTLDIGELQLAFSAHNGVWRFAQGVAGSRFGEMAGAQTVRTRAQARWPAADAPLEGVLQMHVANLAAWGVWVPPGWRLGGNLRVAAETGGRFGAPEWRGELRGSELALRNVLLGVNVTDGDLQASLDGTVARVQRMEFKGGDGRLRVSGEATLGAAPSARLHANAERFRVLARIDRRLITSGSADLQLGRDTLKLDGTLTIDEGLIDFTQRAAAGLDDDVVVVRGAASAAARSSSASAPTVEAAAPSSTPASAPGALATDAAPRGAAMLPPPLRHAQVDLAVKLGDQLQVRGRGLDTSLRGELRLTTPGGRIAVNGTVRAANGTYVAYAQKLAVERGDLAFSGTVDNPRLDILAVRPNLDIRVGVAVTGTLANPRVQLFSEPDMSEMDKLSWLVLGRASEGLGRNDTALLQRAALALLAGEQQAPTDQLLNQLGITDFSFRQSEGEVRETIVSLGRQLSQRWYVGYERSVNATTGTWQLVYRAAQRFTLRAQSGQENALDLIWSWRW